MHPSSVDAAASRPVGTGGFSQALLQRALRVGQWAIRHDWSVRLLSPVIGKFNPFLSDFRRNPYPHYHALRASHPVYFSPVLRGWILTRYHDIAAVLQDPRFSVNRQEADIFRRLQPFAALRPELSQAITRSLLMLDPPDHTRLRRLVNKAFTPRIVERLRPRIEAIVDDLLDRHRHAGELDFINDFAYLLPVTVIAEMLGVPGTDHGHFKAWSDELVALLDPVQAENGLQAVQAAFDDFSRYFRRVFDERRRTPRDDLISALVSVEDNGQRLAETDLLSLSMLLLAAGHETTTNLLGNAVLALLAHPNQRRRLQDDGALITTAVDEFLRYDSPVQGTDRVATVDCDLAGHRVRKGQLVALILGAANRDPARFADPDALDIGRRDNDHLAFSHGTHFCVGAALARLEAEIALAALLRHFPDFRVVEQPLTWKRSMVLRGVTALRLRLH